MRLNFLKYFSVALVLMCVRCSGPAEKTANILSETKKDTTIKYAKRFAISHKQDLTYVYLFGNKENFDTTATYCIYKNESAIKNIPANVTLIKSPCRKIISLSTIYTTMIIEIGLLQDIIAIESADYMNNKTVIEKCAAGQIKEVSKGIEPDLELMINLDPDIIFMFGMGDPKKDVNPKLLQTKIPAVISLDHKEETPLARAEWIKFIAAFLGKEKMADSIFNTVEKNYLQLKSVAQKAKTQPTVFNDIKYSDVWYMPGGKSYMAKLLTDAHTNYLWSEDENFGSIPLSFEKVYSKAKKSEFWINVSTLRTKKEMLEFDTRYAEFAAFKSGNIFNNTKYVNTHGYSTYWETGMIYPDRILNDLLLIFHPELKEQLAPEFYYYEQLK